MLPCMYCTHVAERDCTKSVDEAYACHYFYLFCFCRTTMWGGGPSIRVQALHSIFDGNTNCPFCLFFPWGKKCLPRNILQNENFLSYKTVILPESIKKTPCSLQPTGRFNLQTPNVNYSGRTAPLTSKVAFYIFIQQI